MHDFGKIVYLDLQKTGSSFVSQFLRAACIHPERRLQKHAWIEDDFSSDAVYFITVRHPLMLYSSLYRFGLDRRGGIHNRLVEANRASVYSSFESFTAFMLDPGNAAILHPRYDGKVAQEMGFMSFRYLLLNLQFPLVKISECLTKGHALSSLMGESIISHVLKNENLNGELLRLSAELLPEHFDAARAQEFLARAPRANESKTASAALQLDSRELTDAVAAREALLMAFYD